MGSRTSRLILTLAAALSAAVCGPAKPSGPGTATIAGVIEAVTVPSATVAAPLPQGVRVDGPGRAAGGTAHDPGSGSMGVYVLGTIIGAPVDAQNRFELTDVPQGDRQIQFTAPTVNAIVNLSGVRATERIDLGIVLSATSAQLTSIVRTSGSDVSIEGRVESLGGGALTVAGHAVATNNSTRISAGANTVPFSALAVGQRVLARGSAAGSALTAATIQIVSTDTASPFPLHGTIANLTGSASDFSFDIGRFRLRADAATTFSNGGFQDLSAGRRVEVTAVQRNGFLYAAHIIVE